MDPSHSENWRHSHPPITLDVYKTEHVLVEYGFRRFFVDPAEVTASACVLLRVHFPSQKVHFRTVGEGKNSALLIIRLFPASSDQRTPREPTIEFREHNFLKSLLNVDTNSSTEDWRLWDSPVRVISSEPEAGFGGAGNSLP